MQQKGVEIKESAEEPPAIVVDLRQHSAEGIMAKLETYGFECEAGPLALCVEWQTLKTIIGELRQDSNLLNALRAAGVDNWDGYDFAMESLEGV